MRSWKLLNVYFSLAVRMYPSLIYIFWNNLSILCRKGVCTFSLKNVNVEITCEHCPHSDIKLPWVYQQRWFNVLLYNELTMSRCGESVRTVVFKKCDELLYRVKYAYPHPSIRVTWFENPHILPSEQTWMITHFIQSLTLGIRLFLKVIHITCFLTASVKVQSS